MKRAISNPYKVNYRIYFLILAVSVANLISATVASISIASQEQNNIVAGKLIDIVLNLSYGCIASTLVALLIDWANTAKMNDKANSIYDSIYLELKIAMGRLMGAWADICAVMFKKENVDYYAQSYSWEKWYNLVKDNYEKQSMDRKEEIIDFIKIKLSIASESVSKSIKNVLQQQHILMAYEAMNLDIKYNLSNINLVIDLLTSKIKKDYKNNGKEFWSWIDAIVYELKDCILKWSDIEYYNKLEFEPFDFFGLRKTKKDNENNKAV